MINDDVIIGPLKGQVSLNIENYYVVGIFLFFSSRKSLDLCIQFCVLVRKKIHFASDVISIQFPSGLVSQVNTQWPVNYFSISLSQITSPQSINLPGALFDFFFLNRSALTTMFLSLTHFLHKTLHFVLFLQET